MGDEEGAMSVGAKVGEEARHTRSVQPPIFSRHINGRLYSPIAHDHHSWR